MLLKFAQLRLQAFLDEAGRLAEAEFAYESSRSALERVSNLFKRKLDRLKGFSPQSDATVVKQECSLALRALFEYLPLLGFILRSTNVRNAFETFGPFLRLAGDVLEPHIDPQDRRTQLLLSSEWEYSPFTFTNFPDLPQFLFIGLPASESGNPLTLPVAGHELGHTVWEARGLTANIEPKVKRAIVEAIEAPATWKRFLETFAIKISPGELTTNLLVVELWSLSIDLCLKQAEETFCDFLGLRLFRQSYVYAFAYVLAPSVTHRSPYYPGIQTRVANLTKAAARHGVPIDPEYRDMFQVDSVGNMTQADRLRCDIADAALSAIISELMDLADEIVVASNVPVPSDAETERILSRFKQVIPAEHCATMVDVLNAGWKAFLDPGLWKDLPSIHARKDDILKELVLKNFEVFEIEQIQRSPL